MRTALRSADEEIRGMKLELDEDLRCVDDVDDVLCDVQAHRLQLFGPRYQWIVAAGGAAARGSGLQVSGCTSSSFQAAADGSIRLQIRRLSTSSLPGASGRVRTRSHVGEPTCSRFLLNGYRWFGIEHRSCSAEDKP